MTEAIEDSTRDCTCIPPVYYFIFPLSHALNKFFEGEVSKISAPVAIRTASGNPAQNDHLVCLHI